MSSLLESVLVALAEALPIDDADLLQRHLAKSWQSITQADAVLLGVERDSTSLCSVVIDRVGSFTHPQDIPAAEPSQAVDTILRFANRNATGAPADAASKSIDVPLHQSKLIARDVPIGLLVRLGGAALPDCLHDRFCTATAELLANVMERERRLRDAKLASLAEFSAGAGHEINNPLAAISGRAQLLLRDERDPQRRRHLVTIGAQALRIRDMIGDTMLFARPPQPEPRHINLRDVVGPALDQFANDFARRGIKLQWSPAAAVPIWADESQLRVVISELIRNAVQASPSGGTIRVDASCETREGKDWARLVVRDEGSGLSEEAAAHLFDPFYSGPQAGRGLGFGLAKCWRIVTNHGGRIDIDARQVRGFGIVVDWPASPPSSEPG